MAYVNGADLRPAAVMNVITHRNAYALFPYETYHAKRALVARKTPARREEAALAKYQTRGWKIRKSVYDAEADDPKREFGQATRRVGDKMTWVVPLNQRGEHSALAIDTVVGNSWTLMYHDHSSDLYGRPTQGYAKMMRHTVSTGQERWRQIYTFATSAHHTVFMAYLRHIQPDESKCVKQSYFSHVLMPAPDKTTPTSCAQRRYPTCASLGPTAKSWRTMGPLHRCRQTTRKGSSAAMQVRRLPMSFDRGDSSN